MMTTALIGLALLLCLVLCFFFSGTEVGVLSINRFQLKHRRDAGDHGAGATLHLLENTQKLLVMLLIGQNLFGVLVVLIFEALIKRLWPEFSEQTAFGAIAWGQVLGLRRMGRSSRSGSCLRAWPRSPRAHRAPPSSPTAARPSTQGLRACARATPW